MHGVVERRKMAGDGSSFGTAMSREGSASACLRRHERLDWRLVARVATAALVLSFGLCPTAFPQTSEPVPSDAPSDREDAAIAPIDLSTPLSLEDVYRYAESRNLSYLRSLESVQSSHGGYLSARSRFFPTLSANTGISTSHSRSSRSRFNAVTGEIITEESAGTDYSSGLGYTVRMSLIDPPSIFGVREASASLDAAEYDADRSLQTLRNQIASVYYELVRAKERNTVASEAYELSAEQLRRAETLFELGSVARSDVLQAQVNLASADRDRISAANAIEVQSARLAMALGVPVATPVDVQGLPPLPAVLPDDPESLVQTALSTRPDVRAARAELQAAKYGVKGAKWSRYPTLDGSYSYDHFGNHLSDVVGDFDREYTVSARLGLSWTLFDGFQTKGNIERAEAARRSQELTLEETELQAALDVRESLIAIKNASESIRSAEEGVRLAEESVKLQQALYESGGGTLLEWNNSQVELTRARVSLVDAQVDLHLALSALELALGR